MKLSLPYFFHHPYLLAALAAIALAGCGDNRLAGTSSGVDNPQLTVAFRDGDGTALRVTGDLNIYAQDQNPAVDPQPLWTIKLKSTSLTNLSAEDIARINASGAAKVAVAKVSAVSNIVVADSAADSSLSFNLQLKTEEGTGLLTFGLTYNPETKKFTNVDGSKLSRLDMQPKPLVRFVAQVSKVAVDGLVNRIYIPGTPFQATLVDSGFVFEDLPEGKFPLRLLDGEGRIFTVAESLDTKTEKIFTPSIESVTKLDSLHIARLDSGFAIMAGPNRDAFLGVSSLLEAKVLNADPKSPRLSILWREIFLKSDSAVRHALITNPTSPRTEVRFPVEGVYQFEVTGTLGLITKRDTLVVSVHQAPPPPHPRIVQPMPAEVMIPGQPYKIMWEMPIKTPVNLRFSPNSGEKWLVLAEKFVNPDGVPVFSWIPPPELAGSKLCLIEIRSSEDTTMVAIMDGPFSIALTPPK